MNNKEYRKKIRREEKNIERIVSGILDVTVAIICILLLVAGMVMITCLTIFSLKLLSG